MQEESNPGILVNNITNSLSPILIFLMNMGNIRKNHIRIRNLFFVNKATSSFIAQYIDPWPTSQAAENFEQFDPVDFYSLHNKARKKTEPNSDR